MAFVLAVGVRIAPKNSDIEAQLPNVSEVERSVEPSCPTYEEAVSIKKFQITYSFFGHIQHNFHDLNK